MHRAIVSIRLLLASASACLLSASASACLPSCKCFRLSTSASGSTHLHYERMRDQFIPGGAFASIQFVLQLSHCYGSNAPTHRALAFEMAQVYLLIRSLLACPRWGFYFGFGWPRTPLEILVSHPLPHSRPHLHQKGSATLVEFEGFRCVGFPFGACVLCCVSLGHYYSAFQALPLFFRASAYWPTVH